MKVLITKSENDTFYVFITESTVTKQDCITLGKYTHSTEKRIIPVFECGCFLDNIETPIAVVERTGEKAAFEIARRCKKIIEAVP
jgi:hypothetical protein